MLQSPQPPAQAAQPEVNNDTTPVANPALPPIEITDAEIIAALINYQHNIRSSLMYGKSATERQAQSQEFSGVIDRVTVNYELSATEIDAVLRYNVAIREHLRREVAVFPAIDLVEIVSQARTIIENKIKVHPGYQSIVPGATPLDEMYLEKSEKERKQLRSEEQEKRKIQNREITWNQPVRVLGEHNYSLARLVECFLEAMSQGPDNFLGNPNQNQLLFETSKQFIIPMRTGKNYEKYEDSHFNIIVVNCSRETMTATITFYDSLKYKVDNFSIVAITNFFESKGFRVNVNDVSERHQSNAIDCGYFASLRAIELASEKCGVQEKLVEKFTNESADFRYMFAHALSDMGFNIEIDPSLEKATSIKQQKMSYTLEFAKLLDALSLKIRDMWNEEDKPAENIIPLATLPDLSAINFFEKCHKISREIQELLKKKRLSGAINTPEMQEQIKFLDETLFGLNIVFEEYKEMMEQLENEEENWFGASFIKLLAKGYYAFMNASWQKKIIYGGVALGATFLGGSYSVAFVLKMASLLPTNPWPLMLISAAGFVAVFEGVNLLTGPSKDQKILSAATRATEATLLDVNYQVTRVEAEKARALVEVSQPAAVASAAEGTLAVASIPAAASTPAAANTPAAASAPAAESLASIQNKAGSSSSASTPAEPISSLHAKAVTPGYTKAISSRRKSKKRDEEPTNGAEPKGAKKKKQH